MGFESHGGEGVFLSDFEKVFCAVWEDIGGGNFDDSVELFEVLVFVWVEIAESWEIAQSRSFFEFESETSNGWLEGLILFRLLVNFGFELELSLG